MKKLFTACLVLCFFCSYAHAQGKVGAQWKLARTIKPRSANGIAASPTSSLLAVRSLNNIVFYDSESGEQYARVFENNANDEIEIDEMEFSPDGRILAFICDKDSVNALAFFDVEAKRIVFFREGPIRTMSLSFSPNGQFLAYSCWTKGSYIEVLDIGSNRVVQQLSGTRYPASAFGWQGDGNILATAGGGPVQPNTFGLQQCEYVRWDLNSGRMLSQYFLPGGSSNAVFNSDATLLATMGGEIRTEQTGAGTTVRHRGTSVTVFQLPQSEEQPEQVSQLRDDNFINGWPNLRWSADSKLLAVPHGNLRNGNWLVWDGYGDTGVTSRIAIGGELKIDGPYTHAATFWKSGKKFAGFGSDQISIWTRKEAG